MHCGTEPLVAYAHDTIECIADSLDIPIIDRTMIQYGQWKSYQDYVHLKSTTTALQLRELVADEFVRGAYFAARSKSTTN